MTILRHRAHLGTTRVKYYRRFNWLQRTKPRFLAPKLLCICRMSKGYQFNFNLQLQRTIVGSLLISYFALVACGPKSAHNLNDPNASGPIETHANYLDTEYLDAQDDATLAAESSLPQSTGQQTEVRDEENNKVTVPYKVPGHRRVFKKIQNDIKATVDKDLAKSIEKVTVSLYEKDNKPFDPFDHTNLKEKKSPTALHVKFALLKTVANEASSIEFQTQLPFAVDQKTKSVQLPHAKNVMQISSSQKNSSFIYSLDVNCLDESCTLIDMRLNKYANLKVSTSDKKYGALLGQVGVFFHFAIKNLRVPEKLEDEPELEAKTLVDLQKSAPAIEAEVTSFAVVDGAAESHVEVPDLITLDVPMTDTSISTAKLEDITVHNNQNIEAQLIGLNERNGNMAISALDKKTDEEILLFFEDPATEETLETLPLEGEPATRPQDPSALPATPDTDVPPAPIVEPPTKVTAPTVTRTTPPTKPPVPVTVKPTETEPKPKPKPVLPPTAPEVSLTNQDDVTSLFDESYVTTAPTSEAARVSRAFAEYEKNKEVQRMIKVFQGKAKNRNNCKRGDYGPAHIEKFLTYAPNLKKYIHDITEKIDVTPEIAYLMLLESEYARSPEYPIQVGAGSDLGPWQITNIAAAEVKRISGLPFNIFAVRRGRYNNLDDRSYFMNSTYMAAIYLKSLFKRFPADPALGIVGYNLGPGDTERGVNAIFDRYRRHKVKLADVFDYQMQSGHSKIPCFRLNYAFTFLAARTIGQNLERYIDTSKIEVHKGDKYKARLKSPRGPLPPGL